MQEQSRLIAVVNINYMFPILKTEVSNFDKSKVGTYRNFISEEAKSKYIDLLDKEIQSINTMHIPEAAKSLYSKRYRLPDSKVAKRCVDFRALEAIGKKWKQ